MIFLFPTGFFFCETLWVFSSGNVCALLCPLCLIFGLACQMAFQFAFYFIGILALHQEYLFLCYRAPCQNQVCSIEATERRSFSDIRKDKYC